MISLKDVLKLLLISVYARNIFIFCVHPDKPESSKTNNNTELAKITNNMAELSYGQKQYFNPAFYDYTLTYREQNTYVYKMKLSQMLKTYDLALFIRMDPTKPECADHIKNMNTFIQAYTGDGLKIIAILTEEVDSLKKIYNDTIYFILFNPANDLWNSLLLNNTDLYKNNNYNQLTINFTKLFVIGGKIIEVVKPSVDINQDIFNDILTKYHEIKSIRDTIIQAKSLEEANESIQTYESIYEYPLKCGNSTVNILKHIVKENDLVLYVYIDPTYLNFDKHIQELNELCLQYKEHLYVIGILTELGGSFEKVRKLCRFEVYNPANDLWDMLISNAPDMHDKKLVIPFTKFIVLNAKVIEILNPFYIITKDIMVYIKNKHTVIQAESGEEPNASIQPFQPYEFIYNYPLTYKNCTLILNNSVIRNHLVLYVNIDLTNNNLIKHIKDLNHLYLEYTGYFFIIGILLTDSTEIIDSRVDIHKTTWFTIYNPANYLLKILRTLSNYPDNGDKQILPPFTRIFIANGRIIDWRGRYTTFSVPSKNIATKMAYSDLSMDKIVIRKKFSTVLSDIYVITIFI